MLCQRREIALGSDGIVVGKLAGRFLMFNGTAQGKNVFVARLRSGKTQGLMILNGLNWPGSLVALDIGAADGVRRGRPALRALAIDHRCESTHESSA